MKTYTTRKYKVEAIQWIGDNIDEFKEYLKDKATVTLQKKERLGIYFKNSNYYECVVLNLKDYLFYDHRGVYEGTSKEKFNRKYEENGTQTKEELREEYVESYLKVLDAQNIVDSKRGLFNIAKKEFYEIEAVFAECLSSKEKEVIKQEIKTKEI